MNRVLKYRAFDLTGKKMYYPKYAALRLEETDTVKIMQYTGVDDTDGVEIYEGDIVQKYNSPNHPRKPNAKLGKFAVEWDRYKVGFNITGNRSHLYKVIGNIYEPII